MIGMSGGATIDDAEARTTPDAMIRFILLAGGLIALGACSDSCTNTVVSRKDAPLGKYTAVMFERNCGASTGFSTQISVLDIGHEPSGGGNTFRADDDHGVAFAADWGGPWAETRWLAPDHLLIRYAAGSRLFARVDKVAGVKVSYQQVSR